MKPSQREIDDYVALAGDGHKDETLAFLGKYPGLVDAKSFLGDTALTLAAMAWADMVALLLDQGADINGRNDRGQTALMAAAEWGQTACVTLLLERGADISLVDNDGRDARALTKDSWSPARSAEINALLDHAAAVLRTTAFHLGQLKSRKPKPPFGKHP